MPKISIIVPVYNSEQELRECLNSLIEQTEKDIEIIIIDDGSTDRSIEIEKEYKDKYSNIKLYKNKKNLGQGVARNKGIEIAQGDYITFVDSDDYVHPEMYEELYQSAVEYNMPEIIITGKTFIERKEKRRYNILSKNKIATSIVHPQEAPYTVFFECPSLCNKLFRKDTVKKYRCLDVFAWEDIAFTFTRFLEANTVLRKPTTNYFYRRDITKGVSSKNYKENDKVMDIFIVADEIEQELRRKKKYDLFAKIIKELQIAICLQRIEEINHWQNKDKKEATKDIIFSKINEKYGSLDSVDSDIIAQMTGYNVIEEYRKYMQKCENKNNKDKKVNT